MATEKINETNPTEPTKPSREFEEIELPYEGITDRNQGIGKMLEDDAENMEISGAVSGGDIDVDQYQAEVVGEEAVGGTTPTPDQNVTEYIEKAVGLEMDDRSFLRTNDILEQRDDQRYELDPTSSEDYQNRRE
ncbi:MAG: DUF6335 family protein [Coleofasciculaceae cyanobacterium]